MNLSPEVQDAPTRFWVKVRPRARRERLSRAKTGEICFETTAPPAEGKANAALIEFLARSLRMPRRAFEIRAGATSRRKLIEISGPQAREAAQRFDSALETEGK